MHHLVGYAVCFLFIYVAGLVDGKLGLNKRRIALLSAFEKPLPAFFAEKRTKEIGIRKVLGASASTIVTMLTKDFLKLVLISVIIAFPIAWFLADKFLADYPYRIQLNGWMFGTVALLLVFITILTISYQALKSAMANPVKSLRTE